MTTVATLQVVAHFQDNVTRGLNRLSDRIRFAGMRLRNAGIGLTIAMAPFALIFGKMTQDAMEYEAVARGISVVSKATGRNVADVMAVIDKHSGELMTKLDLTRGVLKLLSTSLTEVQIDEFIVMVKNGAAAMGEDMSVAFNMVSKGLKTYRMMNFDLIGVNERMIEIYKKVNHQLNDTSKAYIFAIDRSQELTSEQKDIIIEQTIFNSVQSKSAVFTGIFAEYLLSTAGRVAMLKTSVQDLSMSLGNYLLPEVIKLVDKLKTVIDAIKNFDEEIKKNVVTTFGWAALLGIIAGVVLMIGGNFLWATGQLTLFFTGVKGLTLFALPLIILQFGALAVLLIGLWFAFGVIVKIVKVARDTLIDFSVLVAETSLEVVNLLKLWAEFRRDATGVALWTTVSETLTQQISDMTKAAEAWKEEGKDLEEFATYPWRTWDEPGRWRKDFDEWLGSFMIPPVMAAAEPGVTPTGAPTFAPPTGGGMPTGNLIINIVAPDGTYGSQVNLGLWATLMERSGQDTVINAGTQNKPNI